jgi:hypothetical protein
MAVCRTPPGSAEPQLAGFCFLDDAFSRMHLSGLEFATMAPGEVPMPQYVIEREIPGAGNLTDAELQASQKSPLEC